MYRTNSSGDIRRFEPRSVYEQESIKRSSLSEELRFPIHTRVLSIGRGVYYGHDTGHTTQYTFSVRTIRSGLPTDSSHLSLSDSSDVSTALFAKACGISIRASRTSAR